MFKTLLSPLTSAGKTGTAVRDIVMVLGAVLALLGALGLLTPQQIEAIRSQVGALTTPEMLAAIGSIMTLGISVYRNMTKSISERAAEAAKKIDNQVPADMTVVIKTPPGVQDIVVPGKAP